MNSPPAPQRVLRQLPPRQLDWYTQAVLLLGGFMSQVGWALLAIGSVFFWTTSVNSGVKYWLQDRYVDWQVQEGEILEADSTQTTQGGERVWHYIHAVSPGDGYRYRGESYSIGKKFDAGQSAFIQYDPADPRNNYAVGLRRTEYAKRVNALLLLPLMGLLLVVHPLRRNLKVLRLLRIGDFTRGRLIGKHPTGEVVRLGAKVMPIFRFDFRFEHNSVAYQATCRTHHPALVEDEDSESILYDRYKPSYNLVYDAVPHLPRITAAGKLAPAPAERAWVLFAPAFTVGVNLVYLLFS